MSALSVEVLKATALRGIISPSAAWDAVVRLGLGDRDFPEGDARAVWHALAKRLERGGGVSPSMLVSALAPPRSPTAVALCHEITVPGAVAEHALEELAQKLKLESRRSSTRDILSMALQRLNSGGSADEALADVASRGDSLPGAWKPMLSLQDLLGGEVETIINSDRSDWITTGFQPLDALIGAVPPTLVSVGADGGIGKSGWALAWARNLAMYEENSLFYALEDGAAKMALRLVALESGVSLAGMQHRPTQDNRTKAHDAAAALWGKKFAQHMFFREMEDPLASWVLTDLEAAIKKYKARLAVIDNTNEVSLSEGQEERHDQRMDSFLKRARRIAERNKCIVLMVTHLSRRDDDSTSQPIRARHFAHSMGLTRIPRVVFGLRQPRSGVMAIDVVKANELPKGTVEVVHEGYAAMPSNKEADPPAPPARKVAAPDEEKPKKLKQKRMDLNEERGNQGDAQ